MRQRIMVLFVILGLVVGAAAFAAGTSETASSQLPWETVKLTGAVSFKDWPHPELTTGGKVYELMVPMFYADEISVKAGDTVTVEGVLMDTAGTGVTEQYLRVTKAVIGGKSYEVPAWGRGGQGARGRFDGRQFGPRTGMMGRGRW